MKRFFSLVLMLAVLLLAIPAAPAAATGPSLPPGCVGSLQSDLETYVVCIPIPAAWNRDLIVFAHGYEFAYPVTPTPKLGAEQWIVQINGVTTSLPQLVNAMGYGFAATSYSKNGLAVQEGVTEMKDLVAAVRLANPTVRNVYIIGASEGGLITTLSLERNPDVYKGGLALCGPIGDFQKQINYWGDFRTALDAIFPGLPADAVNIPDALMADWVANPSTTQQGILATLSLPANALAVGQLLTLTQAPYDPAVPTTVGTTTLGILSYNVLATNEAKAKLGGQPYDNTANLALLALPGAKHYTADPAATAAILPYQTSGILTKPLVTLHNMGDPIVPVWHEALYQAKINWNFSGSKFTGLTVPSYGHCVFKPSELLFSFAMMLYKSNHLLPVDLTPFLGMLSTDATELANFQALNTAYGNLGAVKLYFPLIPKQ